MPYRVSAQPSRTHRSAFSTPRAPRDVDDVCALLASGKNVATTAFMFHPQRMQPADRDRVLAACEAGASSVHGSGINPGNLSGVLPLALSGMSRTIDKITLQERADWSVYESTGITFDNMAFGQPVEAISPTATEFLAFNSSIFVEQVWFIGDALGADARRGDRDRRSRCRASRITRSSTTCCGPGRPPASGGTGPGSATGEPLVEIETLWTVGGEYPGHWPAPKHGWTLTIEGDPSMRTHFILAGQLQPRGKHGGARAVGERGHRDAGAQRRARGLRRRLPVSRRRRRYR